MNRYREVNDLPNTVSAIKKVRVIKTKTLRNQMIKSALKTALKNFDAALESGDAQVKTDAFKLAVKKLDQAAAKGILHKNNAAHKKAKLASKLAKA